MHYFKYTLFAAMLVLVACKEEPKTGSSANSTSAPASGSPAQIQPEVILYAVNVNDLLLRDMPSLASGTVTKIADGSFLTGTGEKSQEKVDVKLRGILYNDVFYKVSTTTPEQHSGWVFGGAISPVYAGAKANSPDLGKLSQFNTFLVGLNTKELSSGKKAWDYVTTNFADANGTMADAAYILLSKFLTRMEYEGEFYTLTDKIDWKPEEFEAIYKDQFDMNKYPLTKKLAENGFRLETGEGMVFPISDWNKLYDFFGTRVTPVMKSYLAQSLKEQKDLDSDDGGMVISLAEMAERAVFWEKFNKENPYFLLNETTRINADWTLSALICGMNNTPSRNYETNKLTEEYKNVWKDVQQKYPGTNVAAKAKEISDLYASTNWTYNETIEAWVTKFQETNSSQ